MCLIHFVLSLLGLLVSLRLKEEHETKGGLAGPHVIERNVNLKLLKLSL